MKIPAEFYHKTTGRANDPIWVIFGMEFKLETPSAAFRGS